MPRARPRILTCDQRVFSLSKLSLYIRGDFIEVLNIARNIRERRRFFGSGYGTAGRAAPPGIS
jgi:hypothetical protein